MIKVGDTRDAAVREGAPQDQQTRLPGLEAQQAADAPLWHQGAHRVLGALQRCDADQELVWCQPGEVVAQVPGRHLRIDVAFLDLQRHTILEMRQERVIERGSRLHPAALGQLTRGAHRLERHHSRAVVVATGADLVGDVAHFQGMGVHALLGDEGADARDPHQYAVGGELALRPVCGHARDGEGTGELVLRGHALPGTQGAAGDLLEDEMLYLQVAGRTCRE